MPVDTFTGVLLGFGTASSPGGARRARPAWAPSPVSDLHTGGAVMWVAGDAIMFGLMMVVFLMWSLDDRPAASGRGWLESARRASLARLVAGAAPAAGSAGAHGPARKPGGAGCCAAPATAGAAPPGRQLGPARRDR